MGGGGHGHGTPKVPDYRIYKVEDVPELMQTKRALASQGLKDPWLRNEVWKYDVRIRGTTKHIISKTIGRGMLIGFGLALATTAIGKVLEMREGHGEEGHGHGHGH